MQTKQFFDKEGVFVQYLDSSGKQLPKCKFTQRMTIKFNMEHNLQIHSMNCVVYKYPI